MRCWSWGIKEGTLYTFAGEIAGKGYSGNLQFKDNPDCCGVVDHGPLPVGLYTITEPYSNSKCGPYTMNLVPDPSNDMKGRADFRIHGDSISDPGTASDGCVILNRLVRTRIWESGIHCVKVVASMGGDASGGNLWGDNLIAIG